MASSPLSSKSAVYVQSSRHVSPYRQVGYHDGKNVRIVESRRRSTRTSTPTSRTHSTASASRNISNISPYSTRSTIREPDVGFDFDHPQSVHVTSKLQASRQTKAIIIQTPTPVNPARKTVTPHLANAYISTPPPTPKIGRLPTPDFDDLDELDDLDGRPFCDCCVVSHVFKYCAACGESLKMKGC